MWCHVGSMFIHIMLPWLFFWFVPDSAHMRWFISLFIWLIPTTSKVGVVVILESLISDPFQSLRSTPLLGFASLSSVRTVDRARGWLTDCNSNMDELCNLRQRSNTGWPCSSVSHLFAPGISVFTQTVLSLLDFSREMKAKFKTCSRVYVTDRETNWSNETRNGT